MALKDYTIYIPFLSFHAFSSGRAVEQRVYHSWKLAVGDTLKWRSDENSGTVKVVSCRREGNKHQGCGPIFGFKKVN